MSISSLKAEQPLQKQRILETALERFFVAGFSKVSMDELAYDLGMSKKTLYRFFATKKDLLRQAMLAKVKSVSDGLEEIRQRQESEFIERLGGTLLFLGEALPRPSRLFLRDLERSAPEIWGEVDAARSKVVREHFEHLIREGVVRGYLRAGLDTDLVIEVLTTLLQRTVRPELLATLPLTAGQMARQLVELLFIGMLTTESRSTYLESLE